MRKLTYAVALLSMMVTAGGYRRAATVIKEDSRESVRLISRDGRNDSLRYVLEVSLDSPLIVVEYIDSPRRVVTATARRVSARESIVAGTNEKSETAVEAISDVRIQEREESPSRSRLLWWAGAVAVAYLAGRFRRHTS